MDQYKNLVYQASKISAILQDVESAKGTSDTLTEKIGSIVSALFPTEYSAATVMEAWANNITVESGGFVKIGNLCIVNLRLNLQSDITVTSATGIIEDLPDAVGAESLASGSSVAFAANSQGISMTITNQGRMLIQANQTFAAGRSYIFAAYLCS